MVRDLQLMKDITPLFEKKLIIWGMGHRGHEALEKIRAIGAGKKGILLCDSNCKIWGSTVCGQYRIHSPKDLRNKLAEADLEDIVILVPVLSVDVQNEILEGIRALYGESVAVYTDYAIEYGIYFNLDCPYMDNSYRERQTAEREQTRKELENNQFMDIPIMRQKEKALKHFVSLPLHDDEIILVYQCGKVGSSSVEKSIASYGRYVLHCHDLTDIGENSDDLYNILNLKSGKIISMVRDPIAQGVSAMWENIYRSVWYQKPDVSFADIEGTNISAICEKREWGWFDKQIKKVFKIDVFQYPFDRERGYTVIKEGNIELLLIKSERLNQLGDIIGSFLNMSQFKLSNTNVGEKKAYRFAYKEHRENLCISEEILEDVYRKDVRIRHFYTEQELCELYDKWSGKRWV